MEGVATPTTAVYVLVPGFYKPAVTSLPNHTIQSTRALAHHRALLPVWQDDSDGDRADHRGKSSATRQPEAATLIVQS